MALHVKESDISANASDATSPAKVSKAELDRLFGSPVLVTGEDSEQYRVLETSVIEEVQPEGILERIWVRDFVHHTWEIWRYRKWQASILKGAEPRVVEGILKATTDPEQAQTLAGQWAVGDENAKGHVLGNLEDAGKSVTDISAGAFLARQDTYQLLDDMMTRAERRRMAVHDEIFHHRARLAHDLVTAVEKIEHDQAGQDEVNAPVAVSEVEDAEFTEVAKAKATGEPTNESAAENYIQIGDNEPVSGGSGTIHNV